MRRMAVVLVVLGLSALLTGCGGGSDYSSPKATFQTMHAAAKAGNRDAMIACFYEPARKVMPELLKMMDDMAKEFPDMKDKMGEGDMFAKMQEEAKKAKVEIGAEKITGQTATLEVTTDGKKETMDFVQEGNTWRLKPPGTIPSLEEARKGMEMMRGMMKAMKGATKK